MDCKLEHLIPVIQNGKLFKFEHINEQPLIVDYTRLDKEFIPIEGSFLEIQDKKERIKITALSDFKKKAEKIVCHTTKSMLHNIPTLREEDIEFVVNQIIVDVLFNMYCFSSEKLTLRQYCIVIHNTIGTNIETTRKVMERALVREAELYNDDTYKSRLINLGRNADDEKKYILKVNEPFKKETRRHKIEWDYFYYNYNSKLITSKQYKRNFSRDENDNTTYENFLLNLVAYDDFVCKLLPTVEDNDKDYFEKSMNYYYLELYKRIDYMYNVALRMDDMDLARVDKNHFLVKRFHPCVLYPKINDAAEENPELEPIKCEIKNKYYPPMLLFERELIENLIWLDRDDVCRHHTNKIITLHTIRAISYELLIYHFTYTPSNYDEVANFIRKCYPIVDLHNSSKIWSEIKNTKWSDIDKDVKKKIKILINRLEHINDALFWESSVRKRPSRK